MRRGAAPAVAVSAPVTGPCAQRMQRVRLPGRLPRARMLTGLRPAPRAAQVVIMIHSGSRGLGHQVATDALTAMERAMARDGIHVNDRQLACAHIGSQARARAAARAGRCCCVGGERLLLGCAWQHPACCRANTGRQGDPSESAAHVGCVRLCGRHCASRAGPR